MGRQRKGEERQTFVHTRNRRVRYGRPNTHALTHSLICTCNLASQARTPTVVRTGSSKNLFAMGSTNSLLSLLEEADGDGLGEGDTGALPPLSPGRLTRVGHIGMISSLQKFSA